MTPAPTTAAALARTFINFRVVGTPVAQGSMVVQRGRVRHQKSERLTNWREAIRGACLKEMRDTTHWKPEYPPMYTPWDGPVEIELWFTYRPRRKADSELAKTTAPDIDKLTRACLDALTGTLYRDDKQVTRIEASKHYGVWESAWDGGPEETELSVTAQLVHP